MNAKWNLLNRTTSAPTGHVVDFIVSQMGPSNKSITSRLQGVISREPYSGSSDRTFR
jgi:hypothetical protein